VAGEVTAPKWWWRPRNLFLAWCAYWVALVVVKLSPAIAAGWRFSRQQQVHGDAGVSLNDGVIAAHIAEAGQTVWAGSITVLSLVLLVAVPPLLLWLIWLAGASRTNNAGQNAADRPEAERQLHAANYRTEITGSSTSKRGTREEL
jgi:hypothetical protein